MDFQQLHTFVTAAKLLNFSKTAEFLGYSQGAVTIQIKQLEAQLNVQLFDRIGKKVALTNEGILFLQYATSILDTITEAQLALKDPLAPAGTLRIGASESLCTYTLPSLLAKYHAAYPHVTLSLKTGTSDELLEHLTHNEVDIVCLFAEKAPLAKHKLLFEKQEPFVFVASSNHPLSLASSLTLKELAQENFLLTEPGCSYRHLLETLFEANNLPLHPLLEIGNTEAIKRFCSQGLGIALLPYFTVRAECAKKELSLLDTAPIPISLSHQLICHKHKYLSNELSTFISYYTEALIAHEL